MPASSQDSLLDPRVLAMDTTSCIPSYAEEAAVRDTEINVDGSQPTGSGSRVNLTISLLHCFPIQVTANVSRAILHAYKMHPISYNPSRPLPSSRRQRLDHSIYRCCLLLLCRQASRPVDEMSSSFLYKRAVQNPCEQDCRDAQRCWVVELTG